MGARTLCLAALGLAAVAALPAHATEPVELTDAQMDGVSAGALLTVIAVDVVDVRNVKVALPVAASVAANVLCSTCTATSTARPGRITQ